MRVQKKDPRIQIDPEAKPTGKPDRPCFYCGGRDWCKHNPRPVDVRETDA